jgi:hypothetical protein
MKRLNRIILAASVLGLSGALCAAEASLSEAVDQRSGGIANAKASQYLYMDSSAWDLTQRLSIESDASDSVEAYDLLSLDGQFTGDPGAQAKDAEGSLQAEKFGIYKLGIDIDRIGHSFAFGVRSLEQPVAGNPALLDINAAERTAINGATAAALPGILKADAASAPTTNLATYRDRRGADLEVQPLDWLGLDVKAGQEVKQGTQAMGTSFGFSNAIEIPAPVNFETDKLEAGLHSTKFVIADASYGHEQFIDFDPSVTFANPLHNVQTAANPLYGQAALAPSNTEDRISLFAAKDLPLASRVEAGYNYAWDHQNAALLPATDNGAIAVGAQPETSANCELNIEQFFVKAQTQPLSWLGAKVGYDTDRHMNNTAEQTFNTVQYDGSAAGATSTEYISSNTDHLTAGINVDAKVVDLEAGYKHGTTSYTNDDAIDSSFDDDYTVGLSKRVSYSTRLRAEYERDNHHSDYYNYPESDGELPWMRRFFEAPYNADKAKALASTIVGTDLCLAASYQYACTNYEESLFGLQNVLSNSATLSADYQVADWLSISPNYSFEYRQTNQQSRQYSASSGVAGAPFDGAGNLLDPNDPSNWTLSDLSRIQTIGLDSSSSFFDHRAIVNVGGEYSIANDSAIYYSPVGLAAVDSTPYPVGSIPNVDNSVTLDLHGKLTVKVAKGLKLMAGYEYQNWYLNTFEQAGATQVYINPLTHANGGLITMQSLPSSYTVQTISFGASQEF